MRVSLRTALAVVLPLAAAAPSAGAQATAERRDQAVAVNLLGIPFGWMTGEYERAVGAGATLGLAGSYIGPADEDDNISSVDVKLRYYPAERGLRGFSLGLSAGYVRIEEQGGVVVFPGGVGSTTRTRVTDAPTVGVSADYNWLVGARRRVLVGLGAGAKRILAGRDEDDTFEFDLADLRAYPTVRFVVGLAF